MAAPTVALLKECAQVGLDPMDALRIAAGTISITSDDPCAIVARFPTIIATFWRLRRGVEPIAPRDDLGHAANFLYITNVEFYTALLLHGLGLDTPLFTPTFGASRVSGWIAHAFEQRSANRIIRPQSEYSGPRDRKWVPLSNRIEVAAEPLTKCN